MRWVLSAATNDAGRRLAREFRRVLPPGMGARFARRFAARQVRRVEPSEVLEVFREQAAALEERGVDLFLLETFADLEDLTAAIAAIRSFIRLPVIAQLTFSEEGATFDGVRPGAAARARPRVGGAAAGPERFPAPSPRRPSRRWASPI